MSGVYVMATHPKTGKQVALQVVHGKGNERIPCPGYGCDYCSRKSERPVQIAEGPALLA